MAADEASFKIWMDSISLGFNEIKGLIGASETLSSSLIKGIPSITYKGSWEEEILDTPLILILTPPSTLPFIWVIWTPAAFPVSAPCMLAIGILLMSLEETDAMLSVTFLLDCLPNPTTTTSSKVLSETISMLMTVSWPTVLLITL